MTEARGQDLDEERNRASCFFFLPTGFDEDSPAWSMGPALGLTNQPTIRLKPVVEFRTAYDVWLLGWNSTGHSPPRQILYCIEYLAGVIARDRERC